MKKLTLTVLTAITLASCSKEYVEPSSTHASGDVVAPYVPAIYEGQWMQDDTIPVSLTRSKVFTDTLTWNMRVDGGYYVLDTNGIDTYARLIKILDYDRVVYKQTELWENGVESIVTLTK